MFKNLALSAFPRFLNPSAILAAIDTAARLNWEVNPYISDFGNLLVNL